MNPFYIFDRTLGWTGDNAPQGIHIHMTTQTEKKTWHIFMPQMRFEITVVEDNACLKPCSHHDWKLCYCLNMYYLNHHLL
jgi:hypothetical protein